MLRINYRFWSTAALLVFGLAARSNATSIFFNGAPNQLNGQEISDFIVADDFTVSAASHITDLTFWDVQNIAGDYKGSISWFIYADASGTPGSIVASGNTSTVTRTLTGLNCVPCGTSSEFKNDFNIGSIALGTGTYWLGLHVGLLADTTFSDFYWETTSAGSGNSAVFKDLVAGGGFSGPTGLEQAFQVFGTVDAGVPEPATFAMLGAGLAGLGLLRARKASRQ